MAQSGPARLLRLGLRGLGCRCILGRYELRRVRSVQRSPLPHQLWLELLVLAPIVRLISRRCVRLPRSSFAGLFATKFKARLTYGGGCIFHGVVKYRSLQDPYVRDTGGREEVRYRLRSSQLVFRCSRHVQLTIG